MHIDKLQIFLDKNQVEYTVITHSKAFTAQGIAAVSHISGRQLAKTVIVKLDGALAMAVLPASYQVDLQELKRAVGVMHAELANESEFKQHFPGCETGAMSPFGNLHGMPVYVDETLTEDEEIAFNAGSHNTLIKLAYFDFDRLVRPYVLSFSSARATANAG